MERKIVKRMIDIDDERLFTDNINDAISYLKEIKAKHKDVRICLENDYGHITAHYKGIENDHEYYTRKAKEVAFKEACNSYAASIFNNNEIQISAKSLMDKPKSKAMQLRLKVAGAHYCTMFVFKDQKDQTDDSDIKILKNRGRQIPSFEGSIEELRTSLYAGVITGIQLNEHWKYITIF